MQQSSLRFPNYANECKGFFVSLRIRQEDTRARCKKVQLLDFSLAYPYLYDFVKKILALALKKQSLLLPLR